MTGMQNDLGSLTSSTPNSAIKTAKGKLIEISPKISEVVAIF